MGLNCVGPLLHEFFLEYSAVDVFYGFLNDIFFSLAYFIVRMQDLIHIQNMC